MAVVGDAEVVGVDDGSCVGVLVGIRTGEDDGTPEGISVGRIDGGLLGSTVGLGVVCKAVGTGSPPSVLGEGADEGSSTGKFDGCSLGVPDGFRVGRNEGFDDGWAEIEGVGTLEGMFVGACVGDFEGALDGCSCSVCSTKGGLADSPSSKPRVGTDDGIAETQKRPSFLLPPTALQSSIVGAWVLGVGAATGAAFGADCRFCMFLPTKIRRS